MENGVKPVWIFDGTPPELKAATLQMRKGKRGEARAEILNNQGVKKVYYNNTNPTKLENPSQPTRIAKVHKPGYDWQINMKNKMEVSVAELEQQFAERIANITGEDKAIVTCNDYLCKGESDQETFSAETEIQHKVNDAVAKEMSKGANDDIRKAASQSVSVTKDMTDDCKYLLSLMGIPYLDSPTEAEA